MVLDKTQNVGGISKCLTPKQLSHLAMGSSRFSSSGASSSSLVVASPKIAIPLWQDSCQTTAAIKCYFIEAHDKRSFYHCTFPQSRWE